MTPAPHPINTGALRKLCEAAPAHGINYAEHYNAGGFYDAVRKALPAILDELDRLRAAEAAGKARVNERNSIMSDQATVIVIVQKPDGTSSTGSRWETTISGPHAQSRSFETPAEALAFCRVVGDFR